MIKNSLLILFLFSCLLIAQKISPEKQADFQRRFKEAVKAIEAGQFAQARTLCEGIIQEESSAGGSMLVSSIASLELFEPEKAAIRLETFRKLDPKNPQGLLLSIEANQALKKTAKVQALIEELFEFRKTNAALKAQSHFIRERFVSSPSCITIIREYYDPTQPPFKVWEVTEVNKTTQLENRSFEFSYHVAAGESRSGDPYFFSEIARINGIPEQINIYREEKKKPDYSVFREWITSALKAPPKPIYSAPYRSPSAPQS